MTRRLMLLAVVLASTLVSGTAVQAQDPAPVAADAAPLSVEVTISRYQGDELVSNLPYVLAVTAYDQPGPVSTLSVERRRSAAARPAGTPRPVQQ